MKSLELSGMSDEDLKGLDLDGKTIGVIGVCGVVGNLVARILMDNGFKVVGTDISAEEDCRFHSSFDGYDIEIFFGGHPEEFFKKIDYIVPPPSMGEDAMVLKLARESGIDILHLGDIFRLFKPEKPVLCISGTNGKTTTTTLLKHIAYANGIEPAEHNLKGMQGNNEFIPSLQTRLHGDVAILETGTDGTPGGLKSIIDLTHANYGILTNITIDHLVDPDAHGNEDQADIDEENSSNIDASTEESSSNIGSSSEENPQKINASNEKSDEENSIVDKQNSIVENVHQDKNNNVLHIDRGFLEYAKVKGELVKGIEENQGMLIYNSDDPTIIGLLDRINFTGESVSFGLEMDDDLMKNHPVHTKPCWCGRDIEIHETISGSGKYECECGIRYELPEFLAYDIDLKERSFTLKSPEGEHRFRTNLDGLHNVYNSLGAIIAARKFLGLSDDEIQKGLDSFKGVDGRMDIVGAIDNKTIMVDYAHNPAGVEAVLDAVSSIYGDVALVVTVSSESGFEGDIDIIESAKDYAKYIVPASHDSRYSVDKLLSFIDGDYDGLLDDELEIIRSSKNLDISKETFVLSEGDIEQKSIKTLGADSNQVLDGLKTALNLDCDIVLIIGEAAFKFKSDIADFVKDL